MRNLLRSGVATLFALSLFTGHAHAADFKIDPAKSQLVVQTFIDGMAKSIGHDHVIQATQFSGKVSFDEAAGTGAITVDAKSASLKADDPALRKKFGLPPGPGEGDIKTIESNMKADDQLATAKYPTISFQSTKIQKQANGQYMVTGNLSLRGKTKSVSFPATVEMQGANFHGKGTLKFNQSEFGYSPYSAMLGALKNKDGVVMTMDIVATP